MADTALEEIVDVAFRLPGGRLPVDHAYALFVEISGLLPWFADEAAARLHLVHTAESGSGWMRPEATTGNELHLSRRTKLTLRVPQRRALDTMALSGHEMDIGGYSLTPGAGKVVPLLPATTLLARHVVREESEDEPTLAKRVNQSIRDFGVIGAKLICGRAQQIVTPQSVIYTRSLVVTNLDPAGSISLLRHGIGSNGKLGCGVFIPYKRIE